MSIAKDDLPKLSRGKTCGDCAHFARCRFLFQCQPDAKECDWRPSRFLEARPDDTEPAP